MNSISNSTNLNIRVDNNLKKDAENLFKRLGLNMSSAINVFLVQSVREQAIPFEIKEDRPNKKLISALKEAKKIANDPKRKGYQSVDDLMKALLNDD